MTPNRINLKVPEIADATIREQAYKHFGLKKGAIQRYVVYAVIMAQKLEEILDRDVSTKKRVMSIVMHELDNLFNTPVK